MEADKLKYRLSDKLIADTKKQKPIEKINLSSKPTITLNF